MNNCNFIGRLTRDPEVRYSQGEKPVCMARFTLAVDRKRKSEKGQTADFLSMRAIGNNGEFAEKYLKKGMKVGITARAEAGSYDKDGKKVYYTEFVCEGFTFCESKGENTATGNGTTGTATGYDGFMNIPDGIDGELPFD